MIGVLRLVRYTLYENFPIFQLFIDNLKREFLYDFLRVRK